MDYNLQELKENPCVYKEDYRTITLKTAFRVKLFLLWKQGDMPALRKMHFTPYRRTILRIIPTLQD